jgi:hypothetical protein
VKHSSEQIKSLVDATHQAILASGREDVNLYGLQENANDLATDYFICVESKKLHNIDVTAYVLGKESVKDLLARITQAIKEIPT